MYYPLQDSKNFLLFNSLIEEVTIMHLVVSQVTIRSKFYNLEQDDPIALQIDAFDVNNLRINEHYCSFEDRSGSTKYRFTNIPQNQPTIDLLRRCH
jgi:hypothetical protein